MLKGSARDGTELRVSSRLLFEYPALLVAEDSMRLVLNVAFEY